MTPNQEFAVRYAELGWKIFPCHWPIFRNGGAATCSCRKPTCDKIGKHPRTKHGHLDATLDRARIEAYWSHYPEANIALVTGAPNGISVVDVDPRHGGDKSLSDLENRYGPLPPTPRNRTGSGGEHIFFRYVPGVGSSAGTLAPGIDIKSDGGYVILPPSLHQSGNRYEIASKPALAPAPDWLMTKLRENNGATAGPAPPEYWRDLFAQGAAKGQRDSVLIKMAGYLIRRGLDPLLVLDIVQIWNRERFRSPLPEEQVTKDVNSICGKELRKRRQNGR